MADKIEIVCSHCGSRSVLRDAYAAWNVDSQNWELSAVFDQGTCDDCGCERMLEEVAIDSDTSTD